MLINLPTPILLIILSNVSALELTRLARINKFFNSIIEENEDILWKQLCIK